MRVRTYPLRVDTEPTRFWRFLKAELRKRDWQKIDLAAASGISHTRLTDYERGKSVSVPSARKIAKALDLPLVYVLVEAEILSEGEAGMDTGREPLSKYPNSELLAELQNRESFRDRSA